MDSPVHQQHTSDDLTALAQGIVDRVLRAQRTDAAAAASSQHPIIAGAYHYLIGQLALNLDNLPPLASFAGEIQNLNQLSSQYARERPSTPRGPTGSVPCFLDDQISPRSKKTRETASGLAQKLGKEWASLRKRCQIVISFDPKHPESDPDIDDHIVFLLNGVQKYVLVFAPHFENLTHFSTDDPPLLQKAKKAVLDVILHIREQGISFTEDEYLFYILASLPVADTSQRSDQLEEPLRQTLAAGLHRRYMGNAHHRLLAFANQVNLSLFRDKPQDKRPYYKGTTIVQSSGTGKTRMLLQLGSISPLLYVCIRPHDATSARSGYPLGDSAMMELALRTLPQKTALTYHEKAAILLAAWFDTLASELESLDTPAEKSRYLEQLNDFGNSEHEKDRNDFFQAVSRTAFISALQGPVSSSDHNAIFRAHLDQPLQRLRNQMRSVQQHYIPQQPGPVSTPFSETLVFVAIDECVTLAPPFLDSICRAWDYISELEHQQRQEALRSQQAADLQGPQICFWLVLLSTNSAATNLVRPQAEHTSTRHQAAVPLPTFVGVGFDVLRPELRALSTAMDAADPEYIKKYGRPLWISLVERSFWTTAIYKLLGTATFRRGQRTTCFNVLASRLALQYVPTRSSDTATFGEQATFARQAVDRHMRILTQVDDDAVLHIASPSEPVLAIAAALVMLPSDDEVTGDELVPQQRAMNRYGSILETVHTMCLVSANVDILKGVRGELVTRVLFMTAWDALKWRITHNTVQDRAWKAQQLLQPERLELILDGLVELDEQSKATVQSQIERVCTEIATRDPLYQDVHAWTHFTHFDVLAVSVQSLSPEFLWYCWKRGVAIQMAHLQPGIDGIIPVFVGDLSRPLGEREEFAASHMTYIAWDAKNRAKAGPLKADNCAKKPAHAGPILKHELGTPRAGLTERGLLTMLVDMDLHDKPARVKSIDGTDSLQVWIRGLGACINYPCLDVLQIREVMVNFQSAIASRNDYGIYNCITNPMDLDLTQSVFPTEGDQEPKNLAAVQSLDQVDQECGNQDGAEDDLMGIQ
ncbi:hypothetical protein [Sporisorium scitamineum]|uniref:Uncharacterized protein n=1 Tax=Sporisorium scitamineum TaxID=49012 RepID=A0A0F7S995_9BASI|nr:hypothetical protein [Sporisorium scitamineum]